ncbi:MAG: transcription elongation factor GreB [Deltaproteobacteria bacterium]|nr:transcription elongation factor GreB [Deltaproteobacteria bacterium]
MSKAFIKESESELEDDDSQEVPSGLKPGQKNYITPAGAQALQEEYRRLRYTERPQLVQTIAWAAGNGDRSENGDYIYGKKRLREIDKRLRFLGKRIDSMEVVDPLTVNSDQVLFGATVTIRDEDDNEKTYSIVGVDEIDVGKGKISWVSPLASSLFRAKEGDIVTFRSPKGPREIEIVRLEYKSIS